MHRLVCNRLNDLPCHCRTWLPPCGGSLQQPAQRQHLSQWTDWRHHVGNAKLNLCGVWCKISPLPEHCSPGQKRASTRCLSQSCPVSAGSQAAPWVDTNRSISSAAPHCCMFVWRTAEIRRDKGEKTEPMINNVKVIWYYLLKSTSY